MSVGSKTRSSKRNALLQIINREYSCQHSRVSYCILRTLIKGGNYSYKKVWEKHSNKRIACEGGRLFFENYRDVYNYTIFNTCSKPVQMFVLPNQPGRKIEDALVVVVNATEIPLPNAGHRPSLYCVDNKNWLVRYDLFKGNILQEVFLSPKCKFKDIAWNVPQISFVLKSIHNPLQNEARQAGIDLMSVMFLAMFDVCPLKFVGMLEINKRVFGKDCVNAMVSQGFLITMHQSQKVCMYSIENIIKEFKEFEAVLYEDFDDSGSVCGHEPVGLPRNINIKRRPAVLFEVKCGQHSLDIGGNPWHYLITPYRCKGNFQVCHLDTRKIAVNGVLDLDEDNVELERANFYGDESGRLLHIGSSIVRILKINEMPDQGSRVDVDFCINVSRKTDSVSHHQSYTSSGRSIRRRVSHDQVDCFTNMTIHNVDYEDDLCVLFISSVHQESDNVYGILGFYDNTTGKLLKEIKLEEPWSEYYEHATFVDMDTIVQIIKPTQGKFACMVYKLQHNIQEEQNKRARPRKR